MQLLRRKAVCERLGGINDVTLWRITRDDPSFPAAVRINKRIVGWIEDELNQWLEDKASQRTRQGSAPTARGDVQGSI